VVLGLLTKFVIFSKETEEHRRAAAEADYAQKKLERDFGKPAPPAGQPKTQPPVVQPKGKPPVPSASPPVEPPVKPPVESSPVAPKLVLVPAEVVQPKPEVVRDIHARLVSSIIQGDELVCTVVLTSLGAKRTVKTLTNGNVAATFDTAKRLRSSKVRIGTRQGSELSTGTLLDADVPVEMLIRFTEVPKNVTQIVLLDLGFTSGLDISIRDAPLQRKLAENATSPPTPSGPKVTRVPAEVEQPQPVTSQGVRAQLRSSLLQGDELVCTVILTNTGEKRRIKALSGAASLTLPSGKKLKNTYIDVGGTSGSQLSTGVMFDKDVPTGMVVRFKGVPEQTATVSIDLGLSDKLNLAFRNAPVQRLVAE
jgi:hypothetical protein